MKKNYNYLAGNQHAKGSSPNKTSFKKGNKPWNKGLKGIHLSPDSEFKLGGIPANKVPIGTVKFRYTKKDNRIRTWVKTEEPNVWKLRAVVVWEKCYGLLPVGSLVHHCDRDTLNDKLSNLAGLSRAEHLEIHRPEFEKKRQAAAIAARWPNRMTRMLIDGCH